MAEAGARWLQIGIQPPAAPEPRLELYRRIARLARTALWDAAADNFFFMHKPPGLRLRFEAGNRQREVLAQDVHDEVARWRKEGLVQDIEPGIYEPETQLFGGERSMDYVHALFTVDSLGWLAYHCEPVPDHRGPAAAWVFSLVTVRAVFDGLGIVDWEDVGVWHQVRDRTGRRLRPEVRAGAGFASIAREIRTAWAGRDQLVRQLPTALLSIVSDHQEALQAGAKRWRHGYFGTHAASVGPRAAAAFYVIFHWNRGGLSTVQQALVAESLAELEGTDDHA